MKERNLLAFIVMAALLGGGWYLWTWDERNMRAATIARLEAATELTEELRRLRSEMESARLRADEAAKAGDVATQRQFIEKMKLLEIKTLELSRRRSSFEEFPCKGERKLAVESNKPVTDGAEKVPRPSAQAAQLKNCGSGG